MSRWRGVGIIMKIIENNCHYAINNLMRIIKKSWLVMVLWVCHIMIKMIPSGLIVQWLFLFIRMDDLWIVNGLMDRYKYIHVYTYDIELFIVHLFLEKKHLGWFYRIVDIHSMIINNHKFDNYISVSHQWYQFRISN